GQSKKWGLGSRAKNRVAMLATASSSGRQTSVGRKKSTAQTRATAATPRINASGRCLRTCKQRYHSRFRRRNSAMAAPDRQDIGEHPHTVADAIDGAAAVIANRDRQLVDPEPVLPRQIQRLDVKAETVAFGNAEDRPGGARGETLESALRVGDPRHSDRLHGKVEQLAHQVTSGRRGALGARTRRGT